MSNIYFIECAALSAIKIGLATDVERRRASLQTANSHPLVILLAVPGERADENRLHKRFREERIRGEWFRSDGELRAFVEALRGMTADERRQSLVEDPSAMSPEQMAELVEASELIEGACLDYMREIGPERCVAEIAESLGPDRAPLPKTILKVLAGENYLRGEWLPWLCSRSEAVRTALLSGLGAEPRKPSPEDAEILAEFEELCALLRDEFGLAAEDVIRKAKARRRRKR